MDIIDRIRQKSRQDRKESPLDLLFDQSGESNIEEKVPPLEEEKPVEFLNITHLGETPLDELNPVIHKDVIELSTEDPDKIRYLKLVIALLESSNYDAAISTITELSQESSRKE